MKQLEIGDRIVHKTFGVGLITALVEKQLLEDSARLYYEVSLEKATIWVPVESTYPSPFRLLTTENELPECQQILEGKPEPLDDNFRVRFLFVDLQLKKGSLEAICEVVRDLTARSQKKHLSKGDQSRLQLAKETLFKEWSASKGIPVLEAEEEVEALLQVGIQKYSVESEN